MRRYTNNKNSQNGHIDVCHILNMRHNLCAYLAISLLLGNSCQGLCSKKVSTALQHILKNIPCMEYCRLQEVF